MNLTWKLMQFKWRIKRGFQDKVWKWLNVGAEVERRLERDRAYLADQHQQAVSEEKAILQRILRELMQVRVERDSLRDRLYFTTTLDRRVFIDSIADRKYLMRLLADETAHEFMRLVPITRR